MQRFFHAELPPLSIDAADRSLASLARQFTVHYPEDGEPQLVAEIEAFIEVAGRTLVVRERAVLASSVEEIHEVARLLSNLSEAVEEYTRRRSGASRPEPEPAVPTVADVLERVRKFLDPVKTTNAEIAEIVGQIEAVRPMPCDDAIEALRLLHEESADWEEAVGAERPSLVTARANAARVLKSGGVA